MKLKDFIGTLDHTQSIMVVYDDDEKLYKIYEGGVAAVPDAVINDRTIKDGSVFLDDCDEGSGHILVIRVSGGEAIQKDNATVVEQGKTKILFRSNNEAEREGGPDEIYPTILSDEEDDD